MKCFVLGDIALGWAAGVQDGRGMKAARDIVQFVPFNPVGSQT